MINKLFLIGFIAVIGACQPQNTEKTIIATSANVQFTMEELITVFTKKTGLACEMIVSSSGKLTAQIKEGAPYDVFVSADTHYPSELYKSGWAVESPKVYAQGKLVLWTMIDSIQPSLSSLQSPNIKHIAIANPKTAPYGVAAIEVLQHYQIYDSMAQKLIYGESISQTNQFIQSRSSEVGFTAKSVVLSHQMKDQGHWIDIADSLYSPIDQSAVLIKKEGKSTENARKFYEFLFSNEAREIFEKYGYEVR